MENNAQTEINCCDTAVLYSSINSTLSNFGGDIFLDNTPMDVSGQEITFSLPLLECTPTIVSGITTPILSPRNNRCRRG